MAEKHMQQI